jgi:hypothetical protein
MAVKRFDAADVENETWDFLCECGAENCQQWVTLTLVEYEELRETDEPILAAGHGVTRSQRARRQARKLSDDARALRAQAELQNKRAGRRRDTTE